MKSNTKTLTEGPLAKQIFLVSLPLALSNLLQVLFNMSDVAVVGRFAGSTALGAVGSTSILVSLFTGFLIGLSGGINVLVARFYGARHAGDVEKTVHSAAIVSLIAGVVLLFVGLLGSPFMLRLLNTKEDLLPGAILYLRVYFLGMPALALYNFGNAVFSAIGDTKKPLIYLSIAGALNILLNLFFVIVLKMNVNGVAIATVLSNAVSSVLLLRRLLHGDLVRVELKQLRIDPAIFRKIMRIGLPAGIQSAIFSVSNIIIQSAINSLGTVVMAASSAAFNIEIIAYDVLNSFSQACTTFVGQNYGAGKIDRCKKTMLLSLGEDIIASAIAIVIVLLTGKYLLAIFNNDPQVIEIGYSRLLILFGSYIFTLTYEILSGYLRGFGISLVPAILTLFGVCGVRIVWINTVFPLHHTFRSIMLVYPISLATTAVLIFIALLIYRPSRRFAAAHSKKNPQA